MYIPVMEVPIYGRSWESSVKAVTVRFPARARGFSLLFGVHPASSATVADSSFLGGKVAVA
jgi:hypothetical protein